MPQKGEKIMFKNYDKKLQSPFVIYFLLESITEKVQPNDNKSYTEAYQKHTDCFYRYKVVYYYDDKFTKPVQ